MKKINLRMEEDNGYCDFYDVDDVDSRIEKIEELLIKGEASEHATTVNNTIQNVLKIFKEDE